MRGRRSGRAGVDYPDGIPEIPSDLSTNELCRRLKLLAAAFQEMEQEVAGSAERWAALAAHLSSDVFTGHQSREVRILVACTLADIFRICAHEGAPISGSDALRDAAVFLIRQLRGLDSPKDPLHARFFYLLENLAKVKTLMVTLDLEVAADSQEVITQLIKHLLASVTTYHDARETDMMVELVVPMLAGADHVSWPVLDALLMHLLEPLKTSHPKACLVASQIVKKCEKELEENIVAFITQALSASGKMEEVELGKHVVELIGELYPIVPETFISIIPQLEFRFQSAVDKERLEMVNLMTRLLSAPSTRLGAENPVLLSAYLGRFNDLKTPIRLALVEGAKTILLRHAELKDPITEELEKRSRDVEEVVRVATVSTTLALAKRSLGLVSQGLLDAVIARTTDKKYKVRKEALLCLATLYRKYALNVGAAGPSSGDDSEVSAERAAELVRGFREKILAAHWFPSIEDKILCEKIVSTCIVPYQLETATRMRTLLEAYISLPGSSGGKNPLVALIAIFKDQHRVRHLIREILELHNKEEHFPDRGPQIQYFIRKLAGEFPEPERTREQLKELYTCLCEESDVLRILDFIVGTDYTCRDIEIKVKEMLNKCNALDKYASIRETMTRLLERTAPLTIDGAAVEALVGLVMGVIRGDPDPHLDLGDDADAAVKRSLNLLFHLSSCYSHCFESKAVMGSVMELLRGSDEAGQLTGMQILVHVCADVVRAGRLADLGPQLGVITKAAEELIFATDSPKVAKMAVEIIRLLKSTPEAREPAIVIFRRVFSTSCDVNFLTRCVCGGRTFVTGVQLAHKDAYLVAVETVAGAPSDAVEDSLAYIPQLPQIAGGGFVISDGLPPPIDHDDVGKGMRGSTEKLEPMIRMGHTHLIPALAAVTKIASVEPVEFAPSMKDLISTKLVKPIILSSEAHSLDHDDAEWVRPELLSKECRAKIGGMKLMSRWLVALKSTEDGYVERTIKMLRTMLETGGDLNLQSDAIPDAEKAHLRLAAGVQLLKLAAFGAYRTAFDAATMATISNLLCDDCLSVCRLFANKLRLRLRSHNLPVEWLGLFGFAGLYRSPVGASPSHLHAGRVFISEEIPRAIREVVGGRRAAQRQFPSNPKLKTWQFAKLEMSLPPLVYLLSRDAGRLPHHSDPAALADARDCIWLVLKGILIRDAASAGEASNIEAVYRLFQTIKDHVDAAAPDDLGQNQKLWALCDVGMMLVQYRSPSFSFMKTTHRLDMSKAYPLYFAPSDQFKKSGNLKVYMHPELLEEEKRLVAGHRAAQGIQKPKTAPGANQSANRSRKGSVKGSNSSLSVSRTSTKATPRAGAKRTARGSEKKRLPELSEEEDSEVDSDDEVLAPPKNRKRASKGLDSSGLKTPRLSRLQPTATSTPHQTHNNTATPKATPVASPPKKARGSIAVRKSREVMPPPPKAKKASAVAAKTATPKSAEKKRMSASRAAPSKSPSKTASKSSSSSSQNASPPAKKKASSSASSSSSGKASPKKPVQRSPPKGARRSTRLRN